MSNNETPMELQAALEWALKQIEHQKLVDSVPFVCLGKDGAHYVYYARHSEGLIRLTAAQHTELNLINLARENWWISKLGENHKTRDAAGYCFDQQGSKRYSPAKIRGVGIWSEDGVPIYNAGDKCFTVRNGRIVETDNVRSDGTIYERSEAMPHPAFPEILTNDEGQHLIDFLSSYEWRDESSSQILCGFLSQSLLSGYLPIRSHVWINAPAGTGKSRLIQRLREIFGKMTLSFTGGTTEAGIRQSIGYGARPILLDEMEVVNGDKLAKQSVERIMSLVRRSTDGEITTKGGQDSAPIAFIARSSFALFSIGNSLKRAADTSRFLGLHIRPNLLGNEVFYRRDRAAEHLRHITPGKLIARLMLLASKIDENAKTLRRGLSSIETLEGRRAELISTVLACRHALTSTETVTDEEVDCYVSLIRRSEFSEAKVSDAERCLKDILESRTSFKSDTIGECVQDIAQGSLQCGNTKKAELKSVGIDLYTPGRGNKRYLFIADHHIQLRKILEETDWSDGWSDILRNHPGAIHLNEKRINCIKYSGTAIPLDRIFPPDETRGSL